MRSGTDCGVRGSESLSQFLLLALLFVALPDAAHGCCKAQFIEKFKLKQTALAINSSSLTVDEARRTHVLTAMSFVPSSLFEDPKALRLEFGVRNGHMINFMASRPLPLGGGMESARDQAMSTSRRRAATGADGSSSSLPRYIVPPSAASKPWDGFDSFQGLPKSTANAARLGWGAHKYSVKGQLPSVPPHVRLHVGWFNETLPPFLDSEGGAGPVAFAHLDADIYASTISVLDALAARCRLRVGTVLSFDEIFGPPRIQEEELRALQEASASHGLKWRFITYLNHPRTLFGRAAVRITEPPPCLKPRDGR